MRTSELFVAKYKIFFENYGASARTRELRQCEHFADKEEGVEDQFFYDFERTFFMMAPTVSENDWIKT